MATSSFGEYSVSDTEYKPNKIEVKTGEGRGGPQSSHVSEGGLGRVQAKMLP
jgi:hypothetical protein